MMLSAIIRLSLAILLSGGVSHANADRDAFVAHVGFVADMPAEYAVAIYDGATAQGVDPFDLAVVCFTEVSGEVWDLSFEGAIARRLNGERAIRYDGGKRGAAGELGFCQVAPRWVYLARRDVPELATVDEDTAHADPWVAARVSAYVIARAQESHAKHGDAGGAEGPHEWIAHHKCAPLNDDPESGRGYHCGTCGYGKRKFARARASIERITSPLDLLKKHRDHWFRYCAG